MLKGTNMNSGEPIHSLKECCCKPIDGKERQEIVYWQSDYLIVSRKSVKTDGEKGIAATNADARDTSSNRRVGQR